MKKSVKKLSLNKMTIANLNASEMHHVNGGVIKKTKLCTVQPLTQQNTCTQSNAACNFTPVIQC